MVLLRKLLSFSEQETATHNEVNLSHTYILQYIFSIIVIEKQREKNSIMK